MEKMSKQQKQIALVLGAAVVLYLVYRWYSGQNTAAASTGAVAPDTASGDYASLAGQEQSDVAGLQGQNSQLLSQEQSDVADLQGALGGLGAQEQADVSGLSGAIAGYSDQFDQLTTGQATLTTEIAALASGVTKINRANTATIQTHEGGAFYKYYVKVTGHKPPANVRTSNFVWQAWKAGVKATALQSNKPHPSSKNNQVAHPNGNHTQQKHTKPNTPAAPPKPSTKPSAAKPQAAKPKPKPPPKPHPKAKPSGTRK